MIIYKQLMPSFHIAAIVMVSLAPDASYNDKNASLFVLFQI